MRLGDDRYPGSGEPRVGTQVGPFTIVCPLDDRGAGVVYLAEHAVLQIRRAVKVLPCQLTRNALAVQRFLHDVRATARLHHRNLIQVHDVGQLASGAWFMVLDDLDGHTLARHIAGLTGPMAPGLVVQLVTEIASGLQIAHAHGIVHRELTPRSVFLTPREGDAQDVALLDFGLAQLTAAPADSVAITRAGSLVARPGAAAYLAPEERRGANPTPASDVFSLGVMAYQMITGGWFPHQYAESRSAHGELPEPELYHRQMSGPVVDPRDRVPWLSAAWSEVVLGAISGDPARRPATPRDLAIRLAEASPGAESSPGGLAIARSCARELIAARALAGVAACAAVDTARTLRPLAAADVGSRYQLGDRLGGGGMAEVFAATMVGVEGFSRRVAIKRVLEGLSRVPTFAAMFVAEAQIASRLAHPNVVSVLDFARDAEDRLYLVMEYVEGKDLASLLATGPVSPAIAIFLMVELLRGLGYAHDLPQPSVTTDPSTVVRGVIHRDVSPQNVLLSYQGAVKLSDFGLAKVRAASGVVRSDVVRGKASYMSPEQVHGQPLDARSDLYAAGVMLWEMLANQPLFGGTVNEISARRTYGGIAPPSSVCAEVPADLEAVAMTMLEHDRDARYSSAEAVVEALLRCADCPRDGRGELVELLATRFPGAAGARSSRGPRATGIPHGAAGAPPGAPGDPITRSAPASVPGPSASAAIQVAGRPRRRVLAAMLGLLAFAAFAAGLGLVQCEVAQSQTTDRTAPQVVAAATPPPAAGAGRVPALPADARISDAGRPPAPRSPDCAASRAPHRRERATRSGELAIIVQPWAMIWLNGKPSGQTPFCAAVPAGRYRVRLANDDTGHDEITTVTVEPGHTATVERRW